MCLNAITGDYFCGDTADGGKFVQPVGRQPLCEIRVADTGVPGAVLSEPLCSSFGGIYSGPDIYLFWNHGPCYTIVTNQNDCYTDDCIGVAYKAADCASYCRVSVPQALCVGNTLGGTPMYWFTWTGKISGNQMSACILNSTVATCTAEGGAWFQGKSYLPPILETEAICPTEACRNDNGVELPFTKPEDCLAYTCTSCYTGTEPSCFSKEACEATNACSVPDGCRVVPSVDALIGFTTGAAWTPRNYKILLVKDTTCLLSPISTKSFSRKRDFASQQLCEMNITLCNDGTDPNAILHDPVGPPAGFNLQNKTECERCGGSIQPLWTWKQAQWFSPTQVVKMSWKKKDLVYPRWLPVISHNAYQTLLEQARAARLATISTSELYCRYGAESKLLSLISCACSGSGSSNSTCNNALVSLAGSPVAYISACKTVDWDYLLQDAFVTVRDFDVPSDTTDSIPCVQMLVSVVPINQFQLISYHITSSLALASETEITKQATTFVYNERDVVVGALIGSGYRFEYSQPVTTTGIVLCLPFPGEPSSWALNSPLYEWDLAVSSSLEDTYSFKPLGLHLNLSATEACVHLTTAGNYFPIGLVENWEDATITNSWPSTEKGLIIFVIIMYFILSIYATATLIIKLAMETVPPPCFIALASVIILCALGASNLICELVGTTRNSTLDPLLVDLPALCLLTGVVCTLVVWRTIYLKGKQVSDASNDAFAPIPWISLGILYSVYVGLLVAAAAVYEQVIITCADQDHKDDLTLSEKLSLAYKVFFAFFVLILNIAFVYHSIVLYQQLNFHKHFANILFRNSVATFFATVGLCILVAVTLYTTSEPLINTTKLAFHLVALITPAFSLVYLFGVKSTFTKDMIDFVTTGVSSSKGASRSSKKQSSGAESVR